MSEEKLNETEETLRINYGTSVFCVPGAVLPKLKGAKKQDIIILLEYLADPSLTPEELAAKIEADVPAVELALAFWRGTGIISTAEAEPLPACEKENVPAKKPAGNSLVLTEVPTYSALEVAKMIEDNKSIADMIDECERIFGRMFGQTDNQKLVSVMNYFGLEPTYILLVVMHCSKKGQNSVGYAVSTVRSLCEKGITTVDALNEYLMQAEKTAELETQIRKMFGMNMSRALSAKEKACIGEWSDKFGYGIDIIRKAYDITVDSIKEPSIKYTHSILEKWYTNDLKTEDQIDAFLEDYRQQKAKAGGSKSFDSEDFFTAALKRSYGADGTAPKVEQPAVKDKRNYGVGGRR